MTPAPDCEGRATFSHGGRSCTPRKANHPDAATREKTAPDLVAAEGSSTPTQTRISLRTPRAYFNPNTTAPTMPCSDCSPAPPAESLAKSESRSRCSQLPVWTAQGTITRGPYANSQFIGTWVINGRVYRFTFTLVNNVSKFDPMQASLSFSSVNDLTGTCTVHGRIGPNHIRLGVVGDSESGAVNAINGKSKNGPIEIHPLVIGSGTWQSS
ncbi:hypothetical protein CERSUDRAFT_77488 [Gelatoporia subvermispora B]|uniref:Uncharacterized protein n=1 Tax=Ceriporiopsis subvermispora (strain B) TaxID=914234 RepID=M2Q6P7_CERS8|nr:hypothetical protein CERSUDRAFT_77488 [Gelatoporia subvermispora B]